MIKVFIKIMVDGVVVQQSFTGTNFYVCFGLLFRVPRVVVHLKKGKDPRSSDFVQLHR